MISKKNHKQTLVISNGIAMSKQSSSKAFKLELLLTDPRAIEIVENTPVDQRNRIIETYIVLGEMVLSHASISTRKETIEEFFAPLRSDIETIRSQLRQIVPTVAIPARKGDVTQETVFRSLSQHFIDDSFEDVSRIGKFTDILATTSQTQTPVLIEVKDYSSTVPSSEVEKFWRDMNRRGSRYGIFVSMRSGIAKCSGAICIKTEMDKTGIFVVDSELSWLGHIFAFYVIKKMTEIEVEKKRKIKGEELSAAMTRVNSHLLELQRHVESIDQINSIAEALKTSNQRRLDELIGLSNSYRRILIEKIGEALEEIGRVKS